MRHWFCAALLVLAAASARAGTGGDYLFQGDFDLGAPGFWDYATFDRGRVYIGHSDKITVFDAAARKVAGSAGPLDEAHGAALSADGRKLYATSGGDGVVKVFDAADLKLLKTLPVGKDADGVIADPSTGTVIVMVGDGKEAAIIDTASDTVVRTVALPAEPEFAAVDGRGKLYVNLVSTGQIAKIDIKAGTVEAVWPLTGCERPHGLAYDPRTRRLFSGCANKVMIVVDPMSGRNVASLPIGGHNDAVGIDVKRGRVFSPNGEGTLTVIQEGPNDRYEVVRTIPTFFGARSMAVDPDTGTLYLTHGDMRMKAPATNPPAMRFGWDGARIAIFTPND